MQNLHIANSDKPVEFYSLDVIISVGYRVKSKRGTQFRIWATGILKEYMRKGFVLDDERLKNFGGGGYFKELLERIWDIVRLKKYSIARYWKFMLSVSTMILRRRFPFVSLKRYKIKSIMQFTDRLQRRLSIQERMQRKSLWD